MVQPKPAATTRALSPTAVLLPGLAKRNPGSACILGSSRVYWQTQVTNARARLLYDRVAEHQGFIVYVHEL
jgi:hypothetical protein